MTAPASRVEPVAAPYPPELQKAFDAIMPPGVPPLALCTTLARVPRIWERFRATVHGGADHSAWSDEERLLVRMVDELHHSASLSDELWDALAGAFSVEQILELLALVGFYHVRLRIHRAPAVPERPGQEPVLVRAGAAGAPARAASERDHIPR
jgi:hypothetical protein